jgi:hypothetical protein
VLFYENLVYDDLVDWAGTERVTRAHRPALAAWRIPDPDKAALIDIGIPIGGDVPVTRVRFQTEAEPVLPTADGRLLYLLAERIFQGPAQRALTWSWGVEPGTGVVYFAFR